ncbi:MAG: type IV secretory system conjugative DNA transfer family protein [Propionibacteriaceae bacterium]|nr:type IV secretory system conjugative DNA transfer family protein [Propionibacteriaceae bacterium]
MDALLADFGHDLPAITAPNPAPKEPRLFRDAPRRGARAKWSGWCPAPRPPVAQARMSSDQAPALWPFVAAPGLKPHGAQMGIDEFSRGPMYCDPHGWVLDSDMPVSNPNMFVFGKPGVGKSATVKAFILRMMAFGYKCLIVGDPKDEYEKLCGFLGVQPIALGQGLGNRVNALEFGPLSRGWEHLSAEERRRRCEIVFARWLTLVRGMVGSQKIGADAVPFGPVEEVAVDYTLKRLTGYAHGNDQLAPTTVAQLWHRLNNPDGELVAECRYADARQFLDETRLLRDALGSMVNGALAGLFDQETNIDLDWSAPIASLSLRRLDGLGEDAVGMALLCLNSWGRAMREAAEPGDMRIVVRDESWKQMRLGVDAVKSFDADLRLSRSDGDIQLAVAHKPSDLLSAGDEGSQASHIAKDMLFLADTKILCGQDLKVARELDELVGLGPMARDLVTGWARQAPGRALWIVGERMFKVQTILHPLERRLCYTQDALEGAR